MGTLDRLARKAATLSAADVEQVATAVAAAVTEALAGHPKQAMPTAAPQSPRVQALLRQVHSPAPAPERPTAPPAAPAATAHKAEAAVAPRPSLSPIPAGEVPCVVHRDELGRALGVSFGGIDVHVTARDQNGRIAALAADNGYRWDITRRDQNGHLAGFIMTPPTRA